MVPSLAGAQRSPATQISFLPSPFESAPRLHGLATLHFCASIVTLAVHDNLVSPGFRVNGPPGFCLLVMTVPVIVNAPRLTPVSGRSIVYLPSLTCEGPMLIRCTSPPAIWITLDDLFSSTRGTSSLIPSSPLSVTLSVVCSPLSRSSFGAERLRPRVRNSALAV